MGAAAAGRRDVLDLAAGQFGLFTTAQAEEVGLPRASVRAWARTGTIDRVRPGVWRVAGVAGTQEQQAMAALLCHGPGSVLALSTAGWVWDLPGRVPGPVDVLRVRDRHRPVEAATHTSTLLEPCDVTVRRGLPVTTPVRTIFDLAGRQHPDRTALDLNHLMNRGLVRLEDLQAQLLRLARRGRPGIRVMRERIAAIQEGERPTESGLELRARRILAEAGFRTLEQQVVLGDDDGVIARVDFCDRPLRIVFEVDSDRYHGGLLDRMLDADKTLRLDAAGWTVVRITEHEIFWDRVGLVARLRRVRADVRRRLSPGP